ncbi:hybrid sensor histidine kinase/response regulator [Pseudomonas sp. CFBP 13710]|uniref:hybrid sensor histidine kinase/response regulator n=1 Tax=Pseudomonas sp. CFBP 13710 TaxID=2775311 RepID=UPI0017833EBA|nr:hybrid sensor histidine kinase/response regulator [Pseudomonas sp. CFBP 13710]MBD8730120.1 response regulator [Pseudomonas sp. CFBP 13710]
MPPKPLQLLFVEDSPLDAELALMTLERAGVAVESTLVFNHQGVEQALADGAFDLILCDYMLPGSSGPLVLQAAQRLAPMTPFIFLSGVYGEEHAVEMMRQGAIDYVLKQNLSLLPRAIQRAMDEVHERHRRRDAERSLQHAEVRAHIATNAARMGVWDYAPPSDTLLWDERCRALYELDPAAEVNLALFLDYCHGEDLPVVQERMTAALTVDDGRLFHIEYRVRLASGTLRWIASHGQAFFEDGVCVRFTGVIQDITEQKQATQALEQLNEMLGERVVKRTRERDRTWELSRELLGVMRFDMSPVSLNPAWESTLGWTREHLGSIQLWEIIHPDDLAATRRETENIANGNVSTRFVNRMRHADGNYRWLSWTIVPDEGLMYTAVRDITGEREVLDELAGANHQLREQIDERQRIEATLHQLQRLEAVGQLTAGVAHDFNNLLTVILASTTFIARDFEKGRTERIQGRLQNIKEAGERGAKLTGQLLSFSRRQRLEPVAVNLNGTVEGMIELLQRTLGGSIWIETDTAPDLWNALVDPTQTEMIILNLAINSRDAMPGGGTLRLSTANETVSMAAQRPEDPEPGNYVVLSIQDSGTGMSQQVVAKAFEPFFTTKEVGKGSGLGLAQVFGFAKQSGGGVAIMTSPGYGTTVKVYLPGVPDQLVAHADEPAYIAVAQNEGERRTILLVDDDHGVREVTATMLQGLGYSVIEADSAEQALNKLDPSVDLVLTDFAMPGTNGGELAHMIRRRHPRLPIVFVTGYAELEGLDSEHYPLVQKPFREQDLASKISAAFRA